MRNFLMNKSLSVISLGLLLALSAPGPLAAEVSLVSLSGHVPAALARMQSTGHLAATNLNLAIGLPLRNREALTNLLQQISDPGSSLYHQYLTPDQFTAQFGPSEADYQAVADFARQHHLTITGTHANRMLLDVSGLSPDIESAFNITFKTYKHPTEARDFFAPDTEPSVPSNLKIQDISGLNNYGRPHPHLGYRPINANSNVVFKASAKPSANAGSGPFGTYLGNDFRNAYVPGTSLNGAAQNIALVEEDGYNLSDIQEYEALAGRTNLPLQNVLLDGFNGLPTYINTGDYTGNLEVSLDIEMLIAMAPALANIIVYEGNPDIFIPNDILNRIASDDSASEISCSLGWSGGPTATTDQIFQQMALQGQSFFTASGDSDAYVAGTVDNPFYEGTPADSPYVTSVGGTTLTMTPGGASRVSETVWNYDVEYGPALDGLGSSGGISSYYPIPYWQTNVNMTACQGSTTFRNFPDVALTADNVYIVFGGGITQDYAYGTSCAAPLWAAFTAMVNQQEKNNGHFPIGFINPALYAIGNSASYATAFNDITTGNNTWSQSPNLFYAVTNYDLCTGLGTPNGAGLINALVSGPIFNFQVSAPPAPYGFALSALDGSSPNGEWALFVQDNATINSGMIANGWSINLTLGSPVGAEADLGLTLSPSAYAVLPGSNVVYYLTVTNYGGMSTATNVLVQDTLQEDVTLLSSSASVGSISRSGDVVAWVVGNLTTNAGGTLALTVQTADTTNIPESVVNLATASSDTPDPNPADSTVSVAITVGIPVKPQLAASFTGTNGAFSLTISGSSSLTTIQASTNLVNWVTVYSTNSAAPFTFTDPNKTNYPYRFYRASVPSQ